MRTRTFSQIPYYIHRWNASSSDTYSYMEYIIIEEFVENRLYVPITSYRTRYKSFSTGAFGSTMIWAVCREQLKKVNERYVVSYHQT
jgi:hypothetical protein